MELLEYSLLLVKVISSWVFAICLILLAFIEYKNKDDFKALTLLGIAIIIIILLE